MDTTKHEERYPRTAGSVAGDQPERPAVGNMLKVMTMVTTLSMAMAQYSHPAYWAPYALVGDGGR